MPSASAVQSLEISLGASIARTWSAAFWRAGPRDAGSFSEPLIAGSTDCRASAAFAQKAEPAASALVAEALERALLDEDAELSFPPPPQAESRTTAAATDSPERHRVRVRRMHPRLAAGRASQNRHGYGAGRDRPRRSAFRLGPPGAGPDDAHRAARAAGEPR